MSSKIAARLLSSGIASMIFLLILALRVRSVGNNIPLEEFTTWLIIGLIAFFDAMFQWLRLLTRGLGLTPIDEIMRMDQKNERSE